METIEKISRKEEVKLKKRIIEEGLELQHLAIEEYRERVDEIRVHELICNKGYDNHQHSFKSETMAELSLLSDQLQLAQHELEQLRRVQNYALEYHPKVEYGTVVKTDNETFFVSVGAERFYVDDMPVFGVSVLSPIYKAMKGKKVGESFIYNGTIYQIDEIF